MTPSVPRLFLNHIAGLDWLIALEFGRVDDGQASADWRGVCDTLGFLEPDGVPVGFKLVDFSTFDVDAPEVADIWEPPLFDVPALGLTGICTGEIIVAAAAFFAGEDSVNRRFFSAAMAAEGGEALFLWKAALEAGDSMAHYGLGYTLYGLGRFQEAYRHLRHYTEISPCGPWPWCYYGMAAEALGLHGEAREAYLRAIELENEGGDETDAEELLDRMGHMSDPPAA